MSRTLLLLLTSGIMLSPVQGQTTYISLSAWQQAVSGNWLFTTNFNNITKDTFFRTAAVNVGPFSFQQIGVDQTYGLFQNFIDVPPLQFTDNSGVTNAALYTKYGVSTVKMSFSPPVFAWGANFYGAETGELVNLGIADTNGNSIGSIPVTVNTGFFGFVFPSSTQIGSITFSSQISNPLVSVGQGFGLENITGAYNATPTVMPSGELSVTASGLVYSRVTRLYIGTVTIANTTRSALKGPFQVVFTSLPTSVLLVNANGVYGGKPYLTVNVTSLPAGQSTTVSVQFSNPSNIQITFSPVAYSGNL